MKVRNYRQNCALARASDLLSERWTLLIVRDLLLKPRRFSELEKRLKGIGTNLLARRLKDMVAAGLIEIEGAREPYQLTQMGKALETMVLEMISWSLRWDQTPPEPNGLHFPDWDLLALKSLFTPNSDVKSPVLAQFEHDGWSAWVRITSESFCFGLGENGGNCDVAFPCLIPALRHPDRVIERLTEAQIPAATQFISAFSIT